MVDDDARRLIQSAEKYYLFAAKQTLAESAEKYTSVGEVVEEFRAQLSLGNEPATFRIHQIFFLLALNELREKALIEVVDSEFAPQYIKKNDKTNTLQVPEIEQKISALGDAGSQWFKQSLARIANYVEYNTLFEYYQERIHRKTGGENQALVDDEQNEVEEAEWEPLAIDRQSPEYAEAVEASEAALREIESSNGYAASDPDERNAIVATAKGALEAIKTGFPSRQVVVHGLIAPLKFVAAKFRDATIGEIAKIAVAKLIAWLVTLGF